MHRCLGRSCWTWLAVLVSASLAVLLTWVGSDEAVAAIDCGSTSGLPVATQETSFSSLQSAIGGLGSGQSGTYYLSGGTITAPSGQNLTIPSGASVTIDLDGCRLSITNAAAQAAAINVPSASTLTIEDTSPNGDGTLQVTGAAGGTNDGGGAGIGGNGGAGSNGGASGTVVIESGTVTSTGGLGGGGGGGGGGAGIGGGGSGYGSSGYTGGGSVSVTIEGGTVTVAGGVGGYSGGGGAGIGGGGGAYDGGGGGGGSGVTTDAGTVTATGGGGGSYAGGGAGIGGGGGGYYTGAGGNGSGVTSDGGTVTATGGNGGSYAGGGAGIGGGGAAYDANGAGNGSVVTSDAGTLTATGGNGGSYAGGGAGIGGGGGGYDNGSGSGGSAGGVAIYGGSVAGSGGLGGTNASSGAGIGGGAGGWLAGGNGTSGTVTAEQISSASLYGELAGPLTIDAGATLTVPSGQTLKLDGSASNSGTIALAGVLDGSGTLNNNGSIAVSGDAWSVAGNGPGAGASGPTVTGNVYEVEFIVPSGVAVPAAMWVYAPTLAASGQSLPSVPARAAYTDTGWDADGAPVTPHGALSDLAVGGVASFTAGYSPIAPAITYTLSSSLPKSASGWYRSPVTVSFTCSAPSGATLTVACPAAVTISSNGTGQTVSEQTTASNGATASTAASGIDIDQTAPAVKIAGPRNRRSYRRPAPAPRCEASETISGIASCRLTVRKTRTAKGYRETVTAVATSNAGSSSSARVTFSVRLRRRGR